ncbi:Myb-like DNA-binding protein [Phytophthora megakarya]|uniref:Myb-like DNA-binding protein n=1 Tax=Phytophthora megakarya TaxID=4795 RepID=A0A225USS7_9STRA|nr:Myb-like DNA-binding protein [Phytophthora megakarya]
MYTKRQRIEQLIERGDRLANEQEEELSGRKNTSNAPATCATFTLRRSSWTSEEDAQLKELVAELGPNWSQIAARLHSRDRKRCRERFVNHLSPSVIAATEWTKEEDEKVVQLQRSIGSKWAKIATQFNGKSAENVKNRCLLLARTADKRVKTRKRPQRWTADEKEKLRTLINAHGARNWLFLASQLPGRTDLQCLQQWYRTLDEKVVKGKGTWTHWEDRVLLGKVEECGRKWTEIAAFLPGRIGNQCRERFLNHLDPSISTEPWTDAEEITLTEAIEQHSTQWGLVAEKLPGRCENDIKNHWYSRERRRMLDEVSRNNSPSSPKACG